MSLVFISSSNNIFVNLAAEIGMLSKLIANSHSNILFLWRNKPVVVIGRNQSHFKECNLDFMKQHHISLARRTTGGGAVYQDLGNTNFSFISKTDHTRVNLSMLCYSLSELGRSVEFSGRNDILFNSRKVSGNAFYQSPDVFIHHGTMLLNTDLENMEKSLTTNKFVLKEMDSIRSRVANLNISHESFSQSLVSSFQKQYGKGLIREISKKQILENSVSEYQMLSSPNWIFRENLHSIGKYYCSDGTFDISLKTKDGVVIDSDVFTDCLNLCFVDEVKKMIKKLFKHDLSSEKILSDFRTKFKSTELESSAEKLINWIIDMIPQWKIYFIL